MQHLHRGLPRSTTDGRGVTTAAPHLPASRTAVQHCSPPRVKQDRNAVTERWQLTPH
jgi:hypothetical protein